jgi:hypothetical protein
LSTNEKFPTATLPPPDGNAPVQATIPNSQTPMPTPADSPTPTPTDTPTDTPPCQTGCGGGPGGGGGGGTISAIRGSPTPWMPNKSAQLSLHTSQPNVGIALIMNLPGCVTQTIEPAGQSDGSGNFTYYFTPQSCLGTGNGKVTIIANFSPVLYQDFYQPCA